MINVAVTATVPKWVPFTIRGEMIRPTTVVLEEETSFHPPPPTDHHLNIIVNNSNNRTTRLSTVVPKDPGPSNHGIPTSRLPTTLSPRYTLTVCRSWPNAMSGKVPITLPKQRPSGVKTAGPGL